MKISKDKIIVIFYILYFTWLLTITYLTRNIQFTNYFSLGVTAFYFLFLREKYDFILFIAGGVISVILTFFVMEAMTIPDDLLNLNVAPLWLPLAWGITLVSLKKFGYMMIYE